MNDDRPTACPRCGSTDTAPTPSGRRWCYPCNDGYDRPWRKIR